MLSRKYILFKSIAKPCLCAEDNIWTYCFHKCCNVFAFLPSNLKVNTKEAQCLTLGMNLLALGVEAIVGLSIEDNELSWSRGKGWNEEWSLEDSLKELLKIPLELTDECCVSDL